MPVNSARSNFVKCVTALSSGGRVSLGAFPWACLGAAFPEIIRQYDLRSQKVGVSRGYVLRSAIFIVGSGLVVMAIPGKEPSIDAVYQGLAAPVMVTHGAQYYMQKAKKEKKNPRKGNSSPPDATGADTVDDLGSLQSSDEVYVEVRPSVMVPLNGWRRFFFSL